VDPDDFEILEQISVSVIENQVKRDDRQDHEDVFEPFILELVPHDLSPGVDDLLSGGVDEFSDKTERKVDQADQLQDILKQNSV
jgi:hypothetical protein